MSRFDKHHVYKMLRKLGSIDTKIFKNIFVGENTKKRIESSNNKLRKCI